MNLEDFTFLELDFLCHVSYIYLSYKFLHNHSYRLHLQKLKKMLPDLIKLRILKWAMRTRKHALDLYIYIFFSPKRTEEGITLFFQQFIPTFAIQAE